MESIGTVKAFFIFFGSLGILVQLARAIEGQGGISTIVGLCLSVSYVVVGLFLRTLLTRQAWLVKSLLIVGFLSTLAGSIARINAGESSLLRVAENLLFALFLTWYLWVSVQEFATKVGNQAGGPSEEELG